MGGCGPGVTGCGWLSVQTSLDVGGCGYAVGIVLAGGPGLTTPLEKISPPLED